nr:MAG TPA: tail tube protein [Caudoviricetes sp.]
MAEKTSFRSVIGVRNIHLAIKHEGNVWDKPVKVIGAQEITIKNTYSEGSLIGDMKTLKSAKKKNGIEVSVGVAEYTNDIKVLLEGGEIIEGTLANSADELGNDVAVMYEEVYDDNSVKYVVVYDVPLRAENYSEGKGNSENIEYTISTLTGTGVAITTDDGKSYFSYELDTGVEGYNKEQAENWYKEVQLPISKSDTVDVEYTGYVSGTVDNISIITVTFDVPTTTFKGVPKEATTFTFDLDGVQQTASYYGSTWSFAISTMEVEYIGYTTGVVNNISISGVTFDTSDKKFKGVPVATTTFTFDLDSVSKTATLSGGVWSFA